MTKLTLKVNHDLFGGLLLVGIGAYAFYHGQQYALGSLARMGPGFLPTLLSAMLCVMGATLAVSSQWRPSSRVQIQLGQLLIVAASLSLFALLLRPAGLLTATFVSVLVSSWADRQITWPGRLLLAGVVAGLASLIFIFGLGMTMPLWWG
ncbi:tripartite tricarboxylate transporter TctB family protein [Billgrantia ethanolica]|uniref:Tripartite tricarboxylate transporter TctB family protein n=1 Tax=Billgrantia ethanolica TaxID=2733486 RepID=A0ABS9A373_9GAMM|nr:tripartite tricarboxylate transporter TctB family protein [Halomonas ethanolica]MCE8003269.1 tripartite tricarboxylate transporter TctB family protein [Halomonas ethanolica]